MKSNDAELNVLEDAILTRMAEQLPALLPVIPTLTVISREVTGVGSFTNFSSQHADVPYGARHLAIDAHILIPGVENGLGALLFFKEGKIDCLELFAYGDDTWDGRWLGYSLVEITQDR